MHKITSTEECLSNFTSTFNSLYSLIESTREDELPEKQDGVTSYVGFKSGFQLTGRQYDRPHEYLQSLLDIVRVQYEPALVGTYFLNSNIGFIEEHLSNGASKFGYASIITEHQDFKDAWERSVIPHLSEINYKIEEATVIFVVVTVSRDRHTADLIASTNNHLGSGFTADEAIRMFKDGLAGEEVTTDKQVYSGFCVDEALDKRMRISLWLLA